VVSVTPSGTPAGYVLGEPSISESGRYVAFATTASDVVPGDTNGASDVFVRDRSTGTTTRVSVATGGAQAEPAFEGIPGTSATPRISANGNEVLFTSWGINLYPWRTDDLPECDPWCPGEIGPHVYVHYMSTDVTEMVDTTPSGEAANDSIPDQGAIVALSANGRYAAFASLATNLEPPWKPEGRYPQVYVKDLKTEAIERVSVTSNGETYGGPDVIAAPRAISNNGGVVVFEYDHPLDPSQPLDTAFVRDRKAHTTTGLAYGDRLTTNPGQLSGDGSTYSASEYQMGGILTWEIWKSPPWEASRSPLIIGAPLLNDNGSVIFFSSESDAAGDGSGPGIFEYHREAGTVTRAASGTAGFTLEAATRSGKVFAGTGCASLTSICGEEGLNVYVQRRQK
jgi:hypothetical protein